MMSISANGLRGLGLRPGVRNEVEGYRALPKHQPLSPKPE